MTCYCAEAVMQSEDCFVRFGAGPTQACYLGMSGNMTRADNSERLPSEVE